MRHRHCPMTSVEMFVMFKIKLVLPNINTGNGLMSASLPKMY